MRLEDREVRGFHRMIDLSRSISGDAEMLAGNCPCLSLLCFPSPILRLKRADNDFVLAALVTKL